MPVVELEGISVVETDPVEVRLGDEEHVPAGRVGHTMRGGHVAQARDRQLLGSIHRTLLQLSKLHVKLHGWWDKGLLVEIPYGGVKILKRGLLVQGSRQNRDVFRGREVPGRIWGTKILSRRWCFALVQ